LAPVFDLTSRADLALPDLLEEAARFLPDADEELPAARFLFLLEVDSTDFFEAAPFLAERFFLATEFPASFRLVNRAAAPQFGPSRAAAGHKDPH
jgi:hypothetical protein